MILRFVKAFFINRTDYIYQRKYETCDQAKRSIFLYFEAYYNRIRRHSGIDYMSPVNSEQ
ncbi:MAG: IS3 family transposase [Nitrosopumilus sp.]|nr:IS3 family transposase [Nitrosopumilus sp.]